MIQKTKLQHLRDSFSFHFSAKSTMVVGNIEKNVVLTHDKKAIFHPGCKPKSQT